MGPIIYGLVKDKFRGVQVLSIFGKSVTQRSDCQSEGDNKKGFLNQGLFRIESTNMGPRIDFIQ
jgi:hypothetical protein